MCSIFGIEGKSIPEEKLRESFDRTISRGPDMSRFIEISRGWLGFHRLAIMGLHEEGMQPFHLGSDLCACNGELYLFRPLKKKLEDKGYACWTSSIPCERTSFNLSSSSGHVQRYGANLSPV